MKKNLSSPFGSQLPGFIGAALLLAACGLAPAARAQASFAPPVSYPTLGTAPLGLAAGDLNGDGRPDLVTANQDTDNVSILLGQAGTPGTFAAAVTLPVGGTRPTGAALGDLNGDGRLDIVTANQSSNNVSVLLGRASAPGTFAAAVTYGSGGTTPNLLALGDLNGDGRLDIVTANTGSSSVAVLLGQPAAAGTFALAVTYPTGGSTVGVALGDLNNDLRTDIVVGNQNGTVGVLLGQASAPGTFAPVVLYQNGGTGTAGVALGDANGDGQLDILTANANSNSLSVLLGQRAAPGTFAAALTYPTGGSGPNFVALGDLNRDGRPDLVTGNANSGTIGVLMGQAGAAAFAAPITYPSGGTTPLSVVLSDVNGDAKPDIVAVNRGSSTVAVLLNTTVLSAAAPALLSAGVKVWPNPAHEGFTVTGAAGAAGTAVRAELRNALGQLVRRQAGTLSAGAAGLRVETLGLPAGVYLLSLEAEGALLVKRVVVY